MSPGARVGLLAWLLVLAALATVAVTRLQPSGDLALFLPEPEDAAGSLLVDSLREGPGSRMLLVAIGGAEPAALALAAQDLAEAATGLPGVAAVAHGAAPPPTLPEALLPARYLLSPAFDAQPLDAGRLGAALRERLQDLGSPAARLVEPWVARDPTLEVLGLAERWAPAQAPETFDEAWMSPELSHALLVVESGAAAFDPQAQAAVVAGLREAFEGLRADAGGALDAATLELSGPGAFAVLMRERTQGEATRLGLLASLGMVLLVGLAYRRWRLPLLAALPLASGVLAGLAAVALGFGQVHGITLAFGITLIGIAQDYPIHLFSHRSAGQPATATVRAIWPTLLTGVLSTCLAFGSFLVSGVGGLRQLAVFSIAGLLTAAACTRWALPGLLGPARHTPGGSRALGRLQVALATVPGAWFLAALLGLASAAWLWGSPGQLFDDRLGGLTPVPAELIARDAQLRRQLGAADVRYRLVVEGADAEAMLQASEALEGLLAESKAAGEIQGAERPSDLLPSRARQRARQDGLPDPAALETMLATAAEGLPFRPGVFEPFQADVAAARRMAPLGFEDLDGTPLAPRLQAMRADANGAVRGLVTLIGVRDAPGLQQRLLDAGEPAWLLDLQATAETMAAGWRTRVLRALAGALMVLAVVLSLALRGPVRAARVLAPVLLAGLLLVAALHFGGVSLSLFHIVAAILAAGLGLDYALFFERSRADADDARRTLHAVLLCAASTTLVFGLLATSSIPVLRAIGLTVALGVVLNLLLAAMLAGRRPADDRP